MKTLSLVNGQPTNVEPTDRGLTYGDGLFETMAASAGRIRWLALHLERLAEGCRRLEIPAPPLDTIEREAASLAPRQGRAVIKLIVTRGPGGRGYAPPEPPHPTRVISVSGWPDYPSRLYQQGIAVRVCALRLGENPALAGLKHLNRLEQVLAQLELRDHAVQQGLLLDTSGYVVGGTSSNLFCVHGSELITPALRRCGVRGVMRSAVIGAAHELGLHVVERELTLVEALAAAELFMTNALVGIWPVATIDERTYAVGPVTRRLLAHFGDERAA